MRVEHWVAQTVDDLDEWMVEQLVAMMVEWSVVLMADRWEPSLVCLLVALLAVSLVDELEQRMVDELVVGTVDS